MQKLESLDIADEKIVPSLGARRIAERLQTEFLCVWDRLSRTLFHERKKVTAEGAQKPRHVEDSLATLAGMYVGAYENIDVRLQRLMDRLQ